MNQVACSAVSGSIPADVKLLPLVAHEDDRGTLTEVFREEWGTGVTPIQWNLVFSKAGVLRGVHVHRRHTDYLLIAHGEALIGLKDLRPDSPTADAAAVVHLSTGNRAAIVIPPGVAHGFYFLVPSAHVYAVSCYWDVADELGCRWDDAGLGIPWSVEEPLLSQRDRNLPPLDRLRRELSCERVGGTVRPLRRVSTSCAAS